MRTKLISLALVIFIFGVHSAEGAVWYDKLPKPGVYAPAENADSAPVGTFEGLNSENQGALEPPEVLNQKDEQREQESLEVGAATSSTHLTAGSNSGFRWWLVLILLAFLGCAVGGAYIVRKKQ